MKIVIGTRGSSLALWQANWVRERITEAFPDVDVSLKIIKTTGDRILDVPLANVGGKGLFVKEIEEAMFRGEIDLAVHSMKDVPAELPDGLFLTAYTKREDPRDAFVGKDRKTDLDVLTEGSLIGTSSLRRQAHLTRFYPHLRAVSIRGNLETRIRKIGEMNLAGVLLAAAGLKRMELTSKISQYLSVDRFIPAVGQGVLGIEAREDDAELCRILTVLDDDDTRTVVLAERAFLKTLEGGCQVPIAAYAGVDGAKISLHGMVASLDGKRIIEDTLEGNRKDAVSVGETLAEFLLSRGAGEILKEVYDKMS